ncbi:hypothetical protein AMTRI_Chr03g144160 [Amborella trichopoda]
MAQVRGFRERRDGGGPAESDNEYHSDHTPVVALSIRWIKHKERCLRNIMIKGNGRSVWAKVVNECDSTMGCDSTLDYHPPCANNIVDGSPAVWKALNVPRSQWGEMEIFCSDV